MVGVVAHTKNYGVDLPSRVETYRPFAQSPLGGGSVILRTNGNPSSLANSARDAILSIDANVPLSRIRDLGEIVDENVAPRRHFRFVAECLIRCTRVAAFCRGGNLPGR